MKNNIKTAREQSGMTQQDCADCFGVKLRAWQTYEQGISEPKNELICRIADKFGVTTDYLLGRVPSKEPALDKAAIRQETEALIKSIEKMSPEQQAAMIQLIDDFYNSIENARAEDKRKNVVRTAARSDVGTAPTKVEEVDFGLDPDTLPNIPIDDG